jgi:hypothetical protein
MAEAPVVPLQFSPDDERRVRFTEFIQAEAADVAEVEELARRLLRGEREQWVEWLARDTREALARALNRLDVTRALLARQQEAR